MSKEYIQALDDLFGLVAFQGSFEKAQKYFDIIEQALNRLEAIDNANPSEAFMKLNTLLDRANHDEILSRKSIEFCEKWIKETQEAYDIIKQALLKTQEPKQYLKWEDLEFKAENSKQNMAVLLNGTKYTLVVGCNVHFDKLAILKSGGINYYFLEADKQFFNDLRLERVEE